MITKQPLGQEAEQKGSTPMPYQIKNLQSPIKVDNDLSLDSSNDNRKFRPSYIQVDQTQLKLYDNETTQDIQKRLDELDRINLLLE